MQSVKPDRVFTGNHDGLCVVIQAGCIALEKNRGRFIGQRTVHIYREVRKFRKQLLLLDFPEEIQQFLRPADCKGRDNQGSAPAECPPENIRQYRNRIFPALMSPCTVCGFNQQVICFRNGLRIPDNRLVGVSDVAGAHELDLFPFILQEKLSKSRPKQVPCVLEANRKALVNPDQVIICARPEHPHDVCRVLRSKCRFHLRKSGPQVFLCLIGRVRLLDVCAVRQHDIAEILRFGRRLGSPFPFACEERNAGRRNETDTA